MLAILIPALIAIAIGWVIKEYYVIIETNMWVGFLGNYSGGVIGSLIGAGVAYFITHSQFKMIEKQESQKILLKQHLSITKIVMEVENVIEGLEKLKSRQEIVDSVNDSGGYLYNKIKLPLITEIYWESVNYLLDLELQLDLLKLKKRYDFIGRAASFDLGPFEKKLKGLNEEADRLIFPDDLEVQVEIMDIQSIISEAKADKDDVFLSLEDDLEEATRLKNQLEELAKSFNSRMWIYQVAD